MGCPEIRIVPTGQIVPRRYHALVRGHLENSCARVRAAKWISAPGSQRTIAWLRRAPATWRRCDDPRSRRSRRTCCPASWAVSSTTCGNLLAHRRDDRLRVRGRPHGQRARRATSGAASRCRPIGTCASRTRCRPRTSTRCFADSHDDSRGPGVIVANDWIELALTSIHDTGRAVWRSPMAISTTTTTSRCDTARRSMRTSPTASGCSSGCDELLPGSPRHHLSPALWRRHSAEVRRPAAGPLRLLYVGRLTRDKGVFDLPVIDAPPAGRAA